LKAETFKTILLNLLKSIPKVNKMPTQNIADKKLTAIITAGMNNTPSSEALMNYSQHYRKDDENRIYRQLPDNASDVNLSAASSFSGEISPSGRVSPVYISSSNSNIKTEHQKNSPNHISKAQWCAVAILTFINLINYMDRYTIAGILSQVQEYYKISDTEAGFLQTIFVISYMIFAPVFGYLGDRYSRKWIMAVGVGIWVLAVLLGSFMENFTAFLIMRAIVGVGEASYSTIAPTIISDMFVKDTRSKMLALFYFAIPVGSGLGYVVGQGLASAFGEWQYSMRGTPVLGTIAVLLIIFVLVDPPRGAAEGQEHLKASSYSEDLKHLFMNKSFLLSTLGFTCVAFCTGALSWWGPKFLETSILAMEVPEAERGISIKSVAFVFGVMTMVAGIIGVPCGALLSTKLKIKFPRADPVICGIGLAITTFLFFISLMWGAEENIILAFVLIFLGEISLNLNWSIVADMLLYVVSPTRRGTAEAVQILVSHAFGDAGSPFLIGIVTDGLKNVTITESAGYCEKLEDPNRVLIDLPGSLNKNMTVCDANIDFYSMQYSLLINVFVVGMGAFFFFLTAIWIVQDKLRAENPDISNDVTHANPGETKEMLEVMECGVLEDSIDSDDVPPTMIMSKSERNNPGNQNCYDRASNLQFSKVVDEYSLPCRKTTSDSTFVLEERKQQNNSRYQPLNASSAISKFQRLLETPDTSNERLDAGHISTSSSTPPSPATPKSMRL
jgi:MFS family permease